jgi:hypothetical protein
VQQPSKSNPGIAAASSAATELFRRAAAEACDTLNGAELESCFRPTRARRSRGPARASLAVDRIARYTREFGPVISAGSGGVTPSWGAPTRTDRACPCAVALTDATISIFRRTLAYRKLQLACRDGRPLPDEPPRAACARARAGSRLQRRSDAPFAVRTTSIRRIGDG